MNSRKLAWRERREAFAAAFAEKAALSQPERDKGGAEQSKARPSKGPRPAFVPESGHGFSGRRTDSLAEDCAKIGEKQWRARQKRTG